VVILPYSMWNEQVWGTWNMSITHGNERILTTIEKHSDICVYGEGQECTI